MESVYQPLQIPVAPIMVLHLLPPLNRAMETLRYLKWEPRTKQELMTQVRAFSTVVLKIRGPMSPKRLTSKAATATMNRVMYLSSHKIRIVRLKDLPRHIQHLWPECMQRNLE